MMTRTLAGAALDRRVALVDAREAYERALTRAAATRLLSERAADVSWHAACSRARVAAVKRREIRARLRAMPDATLGTLHSRYEYMLSPAFAAGRNQAKLPDMQMYERLLSNELRRRDEAGLDQIASDYVKVP